MSDVKLTYKRVGETYEGDISVLGAAAGFTFEGYTFAEMMTQVHRILVNTPAGTGLNIVRTDRPGLLPAQLEPNLLELLRTDPVAYIRATTVPDRVLDLRPQRKSKLADSAAYEVPKTEGLRHGLDTLADAFGAMLYAKARPNGTGHWLHEHPGTGRWADLQTIEHWLHSHQTEVHPVDGKRGWLLIGVETLLKTSAMRFYYPREWNEFGNWITKDQLRVKFEQFKKDNENAR